MRILFVSVIFATLLAVFVMTGNQQAACHGPVCDFFLCNDNCLDEEARPGVEAAVPAEVHFFCTLGAATRRKEPIFRVISSLGRRIIFLSEFFCISPKVISAADCLVFFGIVWQCQKICI